MGYKWVIMDNFLHLKTLKIELNSLRVTYSKIRSTFPPTPGPVYTFTGRIKYSGDSVVNSSRGRMRATKVFEDFIKKKQGGPINPPAYCYLKRCDEENMEFKINILFSQLSNSLREYFV